ncbi:MAG: hypothetical protein R3C05_29015 [Pirellulaceae bacterium]
MWYQRTFTATRHEGQRTLLHFEAVDYRCEVFVNDDSVGTHQGGNTPFSFDITDAIADGDNRLVVRVEDATEAWQLNGKQRINPRGIFYTQVSGIWQTVWIEQVSSSYIADLKIQTSVEPGTYSNHTGDRESRGDRGDSSRSQRRREDHCVGQAECRPSHNKG